MYLRRQMYLSLQIVEQEEQLLLLYEIWYSSSAKWLIFCWCGYGVAQL